ncbi:hypothetical protein KBC80_03520 [Candidatus Woesebacteria bacterium]|nr:hypothetical protein [Candidatus Woesebacteria bacterium]
MKSMTCKDMGGPCDTAIMGNTPDEIVQGGMVHLEATKDTDPAHKAAYDMMKGAETNPEAAKKWFEEFGAKFAAAPDVA